MRMVASSREFAPVDSPVTVFECVSGWGFETERGGGGKGKKLALAFPL